MAGLPIGRDLPLRCEFSSKYEGEGGPIHRRGIGFSEKIKPRGNAKLKNPDIAAKFSDFWEVGDYHTDLSFPMG